MKTKKPAYYITKLSNTSSSNEKKAILREAAYDGCVELFKGFQLAYDKTISFGVKKIPLIKGTFTTDELLEDTGDFNWDTFTELTNELSARRLTGNKAKEALHEAASISCINDWNLFYRSILLKDMRCGVTSTTINKVLLEIGGDALFYLIPTWGIQLAEDSKKHTKKLKGKKALDMKLDGIRLTTVVDVVKQTVSMFTRNGHINTNFPHIIESLEKFIPLIDQSIVFDGEMIDDNFQSLMTQVNRKEDIDTRNSRYALFDMLLYDDFKSGGTNMGLMDRHDGLVELIPYLQEFSDGSIYVMPKKIVDLDTQDGIDEMYDFYNEVMKMSAEAGNDYIEGIMVKDFNGPYECKKSTVWLKWKPIDSVDLTIVGYEEGSADKKRENMLGAFICEGEEDNKQIKVNVGNGMSDDQLKEFWDNRDKLVGEIIEIEFDPVSPSQRFSKSKIGDFYSCRFPRFKRFRSIDKNGKI